VVIGGARLDIPVLASLNVASAALTVAAVLAVFRFKVGIIPTLAVCSVAGFLGRVLV